MQNLFSVNQRFSSKACGYIFKAGSQQSVVYHMNVEVVTAASRYLTTIDDVNVQNRQILETTYYTLSPVQSVQATFNAFCQTRVKTQPYMKTKVPEFIDMIFEVASALLRYVNDHSANDRLRSPCCMAVKWLIKYLLSISSLLRLRSWSCMRKKGSLQLPSLITFKLPNFTTFY